MIESISTTWLFMMLAGLIIISAFFSSAETSMMAINRYRLKTLAKTSNNAKRVVSLLDKIDELIGTILLGNNLVNIFAASISTIIAIRLWGDGGVIVVSLLLTFVILVFAETAPKIFAAKYPEKVALPAGFVISKLVFLLSPVVYVVNLFAKYYLKILGLSIKADQQSINSEELAMAVHEAKNKISDNYQAMLLNILSLEKVKVTDIMIPKSEFVGICIDDIDNIIETLKHTQHTRMLVFDESGEEIVGLLHMRNVVNLYASGDLTPDKLRAIVREPYFVPESTSISTQLKEFQNNHRRLGIVVDEYGVVKGLVVLEDILEEIVGNFTSSQNKQVNKVSVKKDGSYLIDPKMSLRDFNNMLGLLLTSDKVTTLNGWIIEYLQDIPKRNLSFKAQGLLFEVIKVNTKGIKLVKVKKI